MCNKMILAMRRHGSESYSLLAKQLFVWPYPYNKLSFFGMHFLLTVIVLRQFFLSVIFPVITSL